MADEQSPNKETPSSGGVFPPSAVVTPFSAEEIATHTPGDEGREKLEREREKAAVVVIKAEAPQREEATSEAPPT